MDSHLEKCLQELADPNMITAEKALQQFSYPCFSLSAYPKGDDEAKLIFHAYMRFIRLNLPRSGVGGIWEDILKKTYMYSKHFSISLSDITNFNDPPRIWWLDIVLRSRKKCPNPYIRLELYQMIRMFRYIMFFFDWRYITDTFILTICEIQPWLLHPSGNEDDVLFDVIDLTYIMTLCHQQGNLMQKISNGIGNFFRKDVNINNFLLNIQINYMENNESKFLLHFIQLIGIFAVMNCSITNPEDQINTLTVCFTLFRDTISSLLDYGNTFRSIINGTPFHEYVAETIRNLTSAVTNLKKFCVSTIKRLMSILNEITEYLGFSRGYFHESCDLPKLLLNRQIHGSTTLSLKHSIYIRELQPTYDKEELFIAFNDGSSEDESSLFTHGEIPSNSSYSDDSDHLSSNESNDDSENLSTDESTYSSDY